MTDLSTVPLSTIMATRYGTICWTNPELFEPNPFGLGGLPPRESDRYALGMNIHEVSSFISFRSLSLTHPQVPSGLSPFHHLRPPIVVCAVPRGEHPGKLLNASSLGFTDTPWDLLHSRWNESTSTQPTAQQLLNYLCPASLPSVLPLKLCHATGEVVSALNSDLYEVWGASSSGSVRRIQWLVVV